MLIQRWQRMTSRALLARSRPLVRGCAGPPTVPEFYGAFGSQPGIKAELLRLFSAAADPAVG
jgi:hypothetical protein